MVAKPFFVRMGLRSIYGSNNNVCVNTNGVLPSGTSRYLLNYCKPRNLQNTKEHPSKNQAFWNKKYGNPEKINAFIVLPSVNSITFLLISNNYLENFHPEENGSIIAFNYHRMLPYINMFKGGNNEKNITIACSGTFWS